MKFKNLEALEAYCKAHRAFDVDAYIDAKVKMLNLFFRTNGLDAAVLGLSGGVDSAVVYALLLEARKQMNSPLKNVLPLIVPIHGHGTTSQSLAEELAELVVETLAPYGSPRKVVRVDLTPAYEAVVKTADSFLAYGAKTTPFTDGQMASVLRTPVFYYYAAILQQEGYKSLVVGTTNRDEGSYLGFFGKASDGMVDLQPIADLHKSEVYAVARKLGVPVEIMRREPRGDVWDNKCDEEMIGAPYWFIETYLQAKEYGVTIEIEAEADIILHNVWSANIERKHAQNAHKYQVGSPAHFIDILPRQIAGGW